MYGGGEVEREDYRLFKLNRMDCVTESEQFFMCRVKIRRVHC